MWINKKHLVPTNAPLVRFGGTKVYPLGTFTLLVAVKDYPQQITKNVTFLVVNCSSAYNAIIRQPNLNSWKAVTSTYHLMIKIPTEYGVGELQGDQIAACECYMAMLEMDDHLQTMSIKKQRTGTEPVERLEEISLDGSRPDRTIRISTLASTTVHLTLVAFLREN